MLRDIGEEVGEAIRADTQVSRKEWPEYFWRRWLGRWQGQVLSITRKASFLLCSVCELGWEGVYFLGEIGKECTSWTNVFWFIHRTTQWEAWGRLEVQKDEGSLKNKKLRVICLESVNQSMDVNETTWEKCVRRWGFSYNKKIARNPLAPPASGKPSFFSLFSHLLLCEPYEVYY